MNSERRDRLGLLAIFKLTGALSFSVQQTALSRPDHILQNLDHLLRRAGRRAGRGIDFLEGVVQLFIVERDQGFT